MPETWFFVMKVERVGAIDKVHWYWSRFGSDEVRSRTHGNFERCVEDAKAHGFTFAARYHLVTEPDGGPLAH